MEVREGGPPSIMRPTQFDVTEKMEIKKEEKKSET